MSSVSISSTDAQCMQGWTANVCQDNQTARVLRIKRAQTRHLPLSLMTATPIRELAGTFLPLNLVYRAFKES